MKMVLLKVFMVVFFVSMIYINYYANTKPLGGISTGEISDRYNTLFTPAGFTFSIWGIIYILVGVFVVYNVFNPTYFEEGKQIVLYLFLLSTILNGSWLFAWHFDKILMSTIIMVVFLVVLLIILQNINPSEKIGYITFSVYAGWISVALIANVSILITKYDISVFMNYQVIWFIVIILVSIGILITMFIKTSNYIYGLVFLWAYFGIAMKFIQK